MLTPPFETLQKLEHFGAGPNLSCPVQDDMFCRRPRIRHQWRLMLDPLWPNWSDRGNLNYYLNNYTVKSLEYTRFSNSIWEDDDDIPCKNTHTVDPVTHKEVFLWREKIVFHNPIKIIVIPTCKLYNNMIVSTYICSYIKAIKLWFVYYVIDP